MCGICETVIQYVDSLLQDNATEAEIEQALEKVCNFVPDLIKDEVCCFLGNSKHEEFY